MKPAPMASANVRSEGTIEDWHIYYVEWDEESFNFYVDNHVKLTVPKRTWHPDGGKTYTSDDDFPFNKDFYVILNLAIGGNFDSAHTAPDTSFTSATMQVDYVRMYEFQ
jgi:beta-glucanase (GH16 family)